MKLREKIKKKRYDQEFNNGEIKVGYSLKQNTMESMNWSTQIKVGIIVIHACSKFLGLLESKKRLTLLNYTDNKLESLTNNMVTMRFKDRLQPIEYNLRVK